MRHPKFVKPSALVGLVFAVAFFCRSGSAAIVVRTEMNPANGHLYHMLHGDDGRSGVNWFEAEAKAVELGGHLVTINRCPGRSHTLARRNCLKP